MCPQAHCLLIHMFLQVVVADKNLAPSPPGNISRVTGILKDTGGLRFLTST